MVKTEKYDPLHLVFHFTVPLMSKIQKTGMEVDK